MINRGTKRAKKRSLRFSPTIFDRKPPRDLPQFTSLFKLQRQLLRCQNIGRIQRDYPPSDYDVFCAKGTQSGKSKADGNDLYTRLIRENCHTYQSARNTSSRNQVVQSILQSINLMGGNFLVPADHNANQWVQQDLDKSMNKIRQALRDSRRKKDWMIIDDIDDQSDSIDLVAIQ